MQEILRNVGINPETDPINQMLVSQGYHASLHTNAYLIGLHSSLKRAAGNETEVKLAVCKHIATNSPPACRNIGIRTNKSTDNGVIVPTLQIVESSFLVIDIPTIPQGVQFCQCTGHGNDVTPRIIGILRSAAAISTFQTHHIPLKVRDVVVDRAIVGHGQRRAVGIVAEIQNVVPNGHPHQLVTSVDVSVGFVIAGALGTDAAGVVLHLPVQNDTSYIYPAALNEKLPLFICVSFGNLNCRLG